MFCFLRLIWTKVHKTPFRLHGHHHDTFLTALTPSRDHQETFKVPKRHFQIFRHLANILKEKLWNLVTDKS